MTYPIVYRLQPLQPKHLSAVRFHGERTGGDISHITKPEDYQRDGRDAPLVLLYDDEGNALDDDKNDWVKGIREEIKAASKYNTEQQVAQLEKDGEGARARRRKKEGDKTPYRSQGPGPLREFLISVNAEYFQKEGGRVGEWDNKKVQDFTTTGIRFAQREWGESLRYLRIDFDEDGPHIHGVAIGWKEVETPNGAKQKVILPSKHIASTDLEKAQDRAGEAFSHIGIVRGERRAEATREALQQGRTPEPKRKHVSPRRGRQVLAETRKDLEAFSVSLITAANILEQTSLSFEERTKAEEVKAIVFEAEKMKAAKEAAIQKNTESKATKARTNAKAVAVRKAAIASQRARGRAAETR